MYVRQRYTAGTVANVEADGLLSALSCVTYYMNVRKSYTAGTVANVEADVATGTVPTIEKNR
jgi:hypothetical protein